MRLLGGRLASVLGGAGIRDRPTESPSPFELALERAATERHARIAATVREERSRLDMQADALAIGPGFLPLKYAAARMSMSEADVVDLVERGLLLAFPNGGDLYVQPAIITVVAVPSGAC